MAVETKDIVRPPKELIEKLSEISSATAAGSLNRLGIRDPHLRGIVSWTPGKSVVGPALTLQFMPKREDIYQVGEYSDPELQLHRHSLYHTQPGDIIVVDARGHMGSGVFGDMMLTFFRGRGGAGAVIDGCIRDYPKAQKLGLGLWLKGVTPNFHTQTDIFPYAVNVPVSICETFVAPGDIIVADDDGAVVVPAEYAAELVKRASEHAEWEDFSRMRLLQGGHLRDYYPLSEWKRPEFEAWKAAQQAETK
jgi:regulator of RNase E activity RraA